MSTTPNQKDLLAKKSDLEGILKPDDNDVLHLPDVTITLAESGQFYLAGIDKKLLTLVGDTSGNAVTLDGDAGLTFTTSGGSSTITGITSSNGNSTSLAASQSMASAKQDKIVAGTNIQIAQDGKTISATDTNELENLTDVNITTPTDGQGLVYNNTTQKWENGTVSSASSIDTLTDVNLTNLTNGQILKYNSTSQEWENANESGGGGSSVIPNPTGTPTDTLDTVSIDGTIYEIQGSGGGGVSFEEEQLYKASSMSFSNITVDWDWNDYDLYILYSNDVLTQSGESTVLTKEKITDLISNQQQITLYPYGEGGSCLYTPTANQLTANSHTNSFAIIEIVGVKFGNGGSGGGGSTFEGLDYANKTSLNIPDATGYTYTPTENGALLLTGYGSASVICESTSELLHLKPYDDTYSTVWILIEKDVTYTIKKGGGSGSSFGSGSVLYFIPLKNSSSGGGGTGGGLVEDVLWSGSYSPADTSASQLVTLNKNISNYDALIFHIGYSTNYSGDVLFLIDNLTIGNYYVGTIADGVYLIAYWEYTSDTSVTLYRYSSNGLTPTYMKITGLKFGSGGGGSSVTPNPTDPATNALTSIEIDGTVYSVGGGSSGDSFITYTKTVTTTNYGWWTVEDKDGNVLDPDEYIIVDISVTPYYYDVLWSTDSDGGNHYNATLININDVHEMRSSTTYDWTITYAKKDFSGGGGGSTVIPNPSGTATDALTSIEIDGTVYNVGGGNVSAEEITLSDYNALTPEEKNDGTIRFIPKSNIGYGLDIDFTNSTVYKESGMSNTTVNNNSVQIVWDITNIYCGLTIYPTVKVDVTNYDYISYDFTSTNSYDSLHPGYENPVRDLGIGLKSTAPSAMTLAPNIDYTVWNRYEVTDVGTTFTDERIDVSNLTGEYYLIIACAGWNAVVSNIVIGTEGGNPSQIKYMDKTYGIEEDGEGYTEEVIYSATPTTAAPSTLTLTKPYTDFDMLLFNLYRSADGVMNKYDRVVLTSKLSLNDRIQLITYNEWASYDITTTTSFTLINENSMYIGSVVGLKFGEGGGGGGSSVTPNPQGTSTDTLSTIEIDGTIYDIEGSGGGGSTFETVFAGSKSTSRWAEPIIFNEFDVTAYDIIRITAALDGDSYVWLLDTDIIPIKPANTLHILGEAYCDRDNTSFEMYVSTSHNLSVSKIEGLIEGTGSSMVHYSTTEHQVGTWIDGRDVYEKVITATESTYHGDSMWNITLATGIDFLIEHNIMYRDSGLANNAWFPIVDTDDSNWANVMYGHHIRLENNNNLVAYFRGSLNRTGNVEIMGTIRYVKPIST